MSTDNTNPTAPIPGEFRTLQTEHKTLDGIHVGQLGNTHAAWANFLIGDALGLFGAKDLDVTSFAALMAGPRWIAASDFFEQRYGDVVLDETLYDGQAALVAGRDFDHAPTDSEVIDALTGLADIALKETAAPDGTVPASLREHLDAQVYAPPAPNSVDESDLPWLVLMAETTGETVSDDVAVALAAKLAGKTGEQCYLNLRDKGYASRTDLAQMADEPLDGMEASAQALARWATAQPTTSALIAMAAAPAQAS